MFHSAPPVSGPRSAFYLTRLTSWARERGRSGLFGTEHKWVAYVLGVAWGLLAAEDGDPHLSPGRKLG